MDFRALDLAAVRVSPGRGAAVACDAGGGAGGAVRVQTPPCRCFVVPGPGRYTLRLYLDSPLGRDFADFLGRVDALLAPHHDGMQTSSAVWNDSLKLTAFDDAQFFDLAGAAVPDPSGMRACSAVVELGGSWAVNGRWGTRWRVIQVKEATKPAPVPRAPAPSLFADDDDDGPPVARVARVARVAARVARAPAPSLFADD